MYLTDFVGHAPAHRLDQEGFLKWLIEVHPGSEAMIRRVCCKPDKIATRFVSIPSWDLIPDFGIRGALFQRCAEEVFETFYPPEHLPPSDLIHVTCTGYRSPSAAQTLVSKRGWGEETAVTHAYHMGCLAALSAIRIGRGALLHKQTPVDIVHTELCSLHFHRSLDTPEQFVAFSLFADGMIKYTLRSEPRGPSFRIINQCEEIIPGTTELMKWETESWGLKMTLSKEIPHLLNQRIAPFVARLADRLPLDEISFAIHPGGPKILELISKKLSLEKKQLASTEKILYTRGNMSSATLPHIWEEMLQSGVGRYVIGLAFGPGLTMSGILLEKVD